MSASISTRESGIGTAYLKRAAGLISGTAKSYVKEVMPTTTSTISEARRTASEVKSALSSTTQQQIAPILKRLKIQPSFKNISNWFLDKGEEYDDYDSGSDLSFDVSTDSAEIAEEQISEIGKNANQISQAVVESSGKLAEAQMTATANLISVAEKQTSVIAAGFDKTNETLNKILEVMTKNTSALIEATVAGAARSDNDRMISSGKFSLSEYKNILKNNVSKNPELSMISAFLPMLTNPDQMKDMLSSTSIIGGLLGFGLNKGMNKFAPNFRKNAEALDKAVSDTILSSLVRLGENRDYGIKGTLARLFGIDASKKAVDTSRPDLELKAVPFDSVTKEAITNAIPGYLRKILVAVGGEDLIYDYRSRSFRTKGAIHADFRKVATTTGALGSASNNVRNALGDGKMANLLYDLMMVDLGSKTGNGEYREIIESFKNVEEAERYINSQLAGLKLSKKDKKEKKQLAQRLSRASSGMGAIDIGNQVARNNVNRNYRVQQYVDTANAYEQDLSEINDGDHIDRSGVHEAYGVKSKGIKRNTSSIKSESSSRKSLTGLNYTNVALYEIYRRLNEGINVFQVGSGNIRNKAYKKFGDKWLPRPTGHKPSAINDQSEGSVSSFYSGGGSAYYNDADEEDEDTENLSKGQKFARWGKKRGTQFARALFSGSPEDVRNAFGAIIGDASHAGKNLLKKGTTKLNDKFGNVGGYVKHKIMGTGYSYTDENGEEIRVKEGKGALGFITDEFKGMFENAKKSSSDWIKKTLGFFDKPEGDEDNGVVSKRKKFLTTSIGAFAGAGLLGGPLGLVLGGIAGNALSGQKIGKKINKLLFGHDDEGENATGKATGIISRAADAVISPIKFQLGKTIAFSGAMLQKHVFGPMSDLGRSISDRIHNHVDSIFDKMKSMAGKALGKVFGVIGKGVARIATGIATAGQRLGTTVAGKAARGIIGAGTGLIGAVQTRLSNKIAGKRSFHKLKKGEVYALFVGDHYLDPAERDKVKKLERTSEIPGHEVEWMPEYNKYGIWLNGDTKNELMPRTKDYNKRKRKERNTEINENLKKSGYYGKGGILGFLGGDYKKWRDQDRLKGKERRTGLKNAMKEERMSPEEIAAANAAEQEKNRKQQEELARQQQETSEKINENVEKTSRILEEERIPGSSFKVHDLTLEGLMNELIEVSSGGKRKKNKVKSSQTTTVDGSEDTSNASDFANAAIGAIATVAAPSGMDNSETKMSIDAINEASKDKPNKGKISTWLSNIIKHNKEKTEESEEKKSESFISKLLGGLGSGLLKFWPLILGGLTLLSSGFRDALVNFGKDAISWLSSNLPSLLSGAATVAEEANRTIDNIVIGADTEVDEATGERESVVSAEQHNEDINKGTTAGISNAAISQALNPLNLAKEFFINKGVNAASKVGFATINGGVGLAGGLSTGGAISTKITALRAASQDLKQEGVSGIGNLIKKTKEYNTALSNYAPGTQWSVNAAGETTVFAPKTWSEAMSYVRTNKIMRGASMVQTALTSISLDLGAKDNEIKKNGNYYGTYWKGTTAGGYRVTDQFKQEVAKAGANVALSLGAKAAMAGGVKLFETLVGVSIGSGGTLAIAAVVTAIVVVAGYFIGKAINQLIGQWEDSMDEKYSVNSNAIKMQHVIMGDISYEEAYKPKYVYCGRSSDRVLGLDKGMFITNPEVQFGRFVYDVVNGLTEGTTPGCEVLLYDFINNMAYQGVPFACYIAGSSKKVKTSNDHANKLVWKDQTADANGVSQFLWMKSDTVQVNQSTTAEHIDEIIDDIQTNMIRQGYGDYCWDIDDLESLYNAGKEVYEALRKENIINSKGEIATSKFKGGYNDTKNNDGWKSLKKLGDANDGYFVFKCIAYINAHVDVKNNEQWVAQKQSDISKLLNDLGYGSETEINGPADPTTGAASGIVSGITDALLNGSGLAAQETGAAPTVLQEQMKTVSHVSITSSDKKDIETQIKYLAASWAYAHPKSLTQWIKSKGFTTNSDGIKVSNVAGIGYDTLNDNLLENWATVYSQDSRYGTTILKEMAEAAKQFGEEKGDIFGILPLLSWDKYYDIAGQKVGLFGLGTNEIKKYGPGVTLKNTLEMGQSIGNYITDLSNDYWNNPDLDQRVGSGVTPSQMHEILFGRGTHGTGVEGPISDTDWLDGPRSSLLGRIGENVWFIPSDKAISSFGESYGDVDGNGDGLSRSEYINAINFGEPANLSSDENVGGPASLPSLAAMNDGGSGSTTTIQSGNEGNPFGSRPFKVTSPYGWRDLDDDGTFDDFHKGIDLTHDDDGAAPDVFSTFNGTISKVVRNIPDSHTGLDQDTDQGGNMVWIDTDDGLRIKNMHFKSGSIPLNIKEGQKITAGTKIGTMGSTGRSSGAHLHYQIDTDPNDNNSHIDPLSSISGEPINYKSHVDPESSDYSSIYSSYNNWSSNNASIDMEDTSESNSGVLGSFINLLTKIGQGFIGAVTGIFGNSNSSSSSSGSSSYGSINYGDSSFLTGNCNSEWITVVRDVKKLVADQHPSYNQQGSINIEYRGKTLKVRTDCTGIICAMLKFYGVMSDNDNLNTTLMFNSNAIKQGFTQATFPGWDKLVEGDILVSDSHAEIFAMNDGGKHFVYNGGSTNALGTPGATQSSKSTYKIIWRCNEKVSYSTLSGGATVTADSATIWKMLKSKGLSDYAVAGLMGNLYAESGLRSDNLQNTYESKFGLNDQQYTAAVNNGSYSNFVNDSAGYGLAQWTYSSRKQNLLNFAKSKGTSIDDTGMQIDFLMDELQSGYSGVLNGIKGSNSVQSASDIVLTQFEKPADQSSSVKAKRASYGQTFYDQFAGKNDYSVGGSNEDDNDKNKHVGGESSEIFTSNFIPRAITHSTTSRIPKSSYALGNTNHEYYPSQNAGSYECSTESTNSGFNNDEITKLLYDVLSELQQITGNTGESVDLLGELNEKDFVDTELRESINSINKTKNTTSSTRVPTSKNVNRVLSIASP